MLLYEHKCLRIMQVRPRGQKKPSQQGWQSTDLTGISFLALSMLTFSLALQAHPGSQPLTHEDKLQFMFGFKKLVLDFPLAKLCP